MKFNNIPEIQTSSFDNYKLSRNSSIIHPMASQKQISKTIEYLNDSTGT